MALPPGINPPRCGDPLGPEYEYVKRDSAERQADAWNRVLADDPVLGPDGGLQVGVGPKVGRHHPLVWVAARPAG